MHITRWRPGPAKLLFLACLTVSVTNVLLVSVRIPLSPSETASLGNHVPIPLQASTSDPNGTTSNRTSVLNANKLLQGKPMEDNGGSVLLQVQAVAPGENFTKVTATNTPTSSLAVWREATSKFVAPWDPVFALGGAERLGQAEACRNDVFNLCQDTFPVRNCLEQKEHFLSTGCKKILFPCKDKKNDEEACKMARTYVNALPTQDTVDMESLLQAIDVAASKSGAIYWMTAGSSIGSLLHHGRIPWDDDVDVHVPQQHLESLFQNLDPCFVATNRYKGLVWKIHDVNATKLGNSDVGWPSIDVFPVDCLSNATHCLEAPILQRQHSIAINKEWTFPLKRRPFGRLSLPFPNHLSKIVHHRYGPSVAENCVVGGMIHSKERFVRTRKMSYNCFDLYFVPSMVHHNNHAAHDDRNRPWPEQPDFTVEHLMDGNTILSTVTYDQNQEVKRSYASGLMGVDGRAVSVTLPNFAKSPERPVPYLEWERVAYLHNVANRSAETLNKEVLPMLDRVEVSNKYYNASLADEKLRIVVWNAERGTEWDTLPEFAPDCNVVILNEMDWGMARSGNVHTTQLLANHLQMNYAYGVEFLELTNGNAQEINATVGKTNTVGYHGNVVMCKWPITDTKVIRLHPLYDHLFSEKTTGADSGERRLGGRMALLARTLLPNGQSLVLVSVHGHGGAKALLLKRDAASICHEIMAFSGNNNTAGVIVGGDMAGVLAGTLQQECKFLPLPQTNNYRKGGKRPVPTWRVECKNGGPPRARFERGDWLLAGGPSLFIQNDTVQTIHPYKKLTNGKYRCISDHSMLMATARLR